jgi:hypothetical protein
LAKIFSASVIGRRQWRLPNRDLSLKPRDIEREQSAVLYDLTRYFVFTASELFQRYLIAGRHSLNHLKICRGQQPEVLTILLVDSFVILCNYQPIPAAISAYGEASRLDPLPRRFPETDATKPPFLTSLRLTETDRRTSAPDR